MITETNPRVFKWLLPPTENICLSPMKESLTPLFPKWCSMDHQGSAVKTRASQENSITIEKNGNLNIITTNVT
jgi:hypothetical protein